MIDEELKANTLDHINKMLEEIRSLSLLVETGLKIADKDIDYVSHFRLFNAKSFLGLAQADLLTALREIEKCASRKGSERIVEELITMATEHLSLARLSYAYYMEYRNNPERSVEEIFEAAADTVESLYI